ncbi:hypothetical protein [Legionella parisiensis]|uniref:Uncharacterized protein n=1 Tax=Legionella parisiensis TaxID=45071 RepID=A0A1E5JPT5_9GAMM|nr:hypothetical protein [Legionella parisiensis]KTD44254.1 hypothetical protein Lpar_0340 [Legionella parisiensis]OEH46048.1 hypothetical protein lpari_02930 [Legionella parisiensis]STX71879.1 Uncharacterised protein [Legionella parisiensis]
MTSHIDDTPSEPTYTSTSYKVQYQKAKETPEQKLIRELETQLSEVQGKKGERHEHKANVIKAALDFLKEQDPMERQEKRRELTEAIRDNPKYDKALFSSKTKDLIDQVVNAHPDNSQSYNL